MKISGTIGFITLTVSNKKHKARVTKAKKGEQRLTTGNPRQSGRKIQVHRLIFSFHPSTTARVSHIYTATYPEKQRNARPK